MKQSPPPSAGQRGTPDGGRWCLSHHRSRPGSLRAKEAHRKDAGQPEHPHNNQAQRNETNTQASMCTKFPTARSASSAAARASSRGASRVDRAVCHRHRAYYRSITSTGAAAQAAGAKTPESTSPSRRWTAASTRFWASHQVGHHYGARERQPFDAARPRVVLIAARARHLPNLRRGTGTHTHTPARRGARPTGAIPGDAGEASTCGTAARRLPLRRAAARLAPRRRPRHRTPLGGPAKSDGADGKSGGVSGHLPAQHRGRLLQLGAGARGWRPPSRKPASRPWAGARTAAGAALFAAAFYKRAFDQADAVADPNIAPAASAFLGATQDVLAPRAAAFVAQAPRSPACPARGGGGSVDIEMDGPAKGMDGSGPSRPRTRTGRCPCSRCPRRRWRWIAQRGRRASRPRSVTSRWTGVARRRRAARRRDGWRARRRLRERGAGGAGPRRPEGDHGIGSVDADGRGSRRRSVAAALGHGLVGRVAAHVARRFGLRPAVFPVHRRRCRAGPAAREAKQAAEARPSARRRRATP